MYLICAQEAATIRARRAADLFTQDTALYEGSPYPEPPRAGLPQPSLGSGRARATGGGAPGAAAGGGAWGDQGWVGARRVRLITGGLGRLDAINPID